MPDCLIKNSSGRPARWPLVLTSLLALLAAGCHRDDVQVYRVAKDQDQSSSQSSSALPTDSPNPGLPPGHPDISSTSPASFPTATGLPHLTWTTPPGWTEKAPGEMRVASFAVNSPDGKQADISVIPLPGQAGSDEANVNRWRGQVGLPALPPEDLTKSAENIEAAGQPAQLYDIPGQNPSSSAPERILAVIQRRDGVAWFYKMTGDADLVEQQKTAFLAFLKSLTFSAAAPAEAAMPAGHPAVGNMGMGMDASATPAGPVSTEGLPNWQVPAHWQQVPAGQFLVAKFNVAGASGQTAEVNVSSSAGAGGGVAANVNRWRGQLGLAPLAEAGVESSLTTLATAGGKASMTDLTGTNARTGQPTRLVGVIVPVGDQTWFYKLMGDDAVVESQKAAFTQFVQSVKY